MSAIADLAERLSSIEFEQLDQTVVEAARQRLFDTIASFIAGAATAEAALMREVVGPRPAATTESIRCMCATTRCTEVDDIHIGSCTTVGSIVVPVALISAAHECLSDGNLICSLVAGYDAMTRLGCAV